MWLLSYVSCFYMQVTQEIGGMCYIIKMYYVGTRLERTCNVMEDNPSGLSRLSY
jgi:hypothetical protein